MEEKKFKIVKKDEISSTEHEFTIEIPAEVLSREEGKAIKDLSRDLELPGFRKGKVPEEMAKKELGDFRILEQSAYNIINNLAPLIIAQEDIDALTLPQISITKIAKGSPLEFKMKLTIIPKVKLPDYKKIASEIKKEKDLKVSDEEFENYLLFVKKQKAKIDKQFGKTPEKKDKTEKEGKKCDHEGLCDHDKPEEIKDEDLPEIDDDFVKAIGGFKNVDDFKAKIRENLLREKEIQAQQKHRLAIIDEILKQTKTDVPGVLIDQELERMILQFNDQIRQMKINPDEYYKNIGKTEDDLRKEWKEEARKKALMDLILPEIAIKENIKVDPKKMEEELKHIKEHHKDVSDMQARMYVERVLTNEEVFKLLESL